MSSAVRLTSTNIYQHSFATSDTCLGFKDANSWNRTFGLVVMTSYG
jgi:hypothetical protein